MCSLQTRRVGLDTNWLSNLKVCLQSCFSYGNNDNLSSRYYRNSSSSPSARSYFKKLLMFRSKLEKINNPNMDLYQFWKHSGPCTMEVVGLKINGDSHISIYNTVGDFQENTNRILKFQYHTGYCPKAAWHNANINRFSSDCSQFSLWVCLCPLLPQKESRQSHANTAPPCQSVNCLMCPQAPQSSHQEPLTDWLLQHQIGNFQQQWLPCSAWH